MNEQKLSNKLSKIKVLILVGGLGTRLRSVVSEVPKPMAPIKDKPFLFYKLQQIKIITYNLCISVRKDSIFFFKNVNTIIEYSE